MAQIEMHGISSVRMGDTSWLKREILLYDKIGLMYLDGCVSMLYDRTSSQKRAVDYEYLKSQGVVYQAAIPDRSVDSDVNACLVFAEEAHHRFESYLPSMQQIVDPEYNKSNWFEKAVVHQADADALLARAVAIGLGRSPDIIATPIITPSSFVSQNAICSKSNVIHAVLHEFPIPHESVPFEDILMLRAESEFISKRNALRSWMRRFTGHDLSVAEIRDEIRHALDEYERYMRIQKLKYTNSSLSAIVKYPLGLLEDAVTFKFRNLTDSAFSIFGENVSLLESEIDAPGRELAYISALNTRLRA